MFSEPHGRTDLRSVNGFVATGTPTGAATDKTGMISSPDKKLPLRGLLLEMAFQTENMIPLHEHSLVNRPVHSMAGRATLAHRLVFEDERPALGDVTAAASLALDGESSPASDDRVTFVGIVAVAA